MKKSQTNEEIYSITKRMIFSVDDFDFIEMQRITYLWNEILVCLLRATPDLDLSRNRMVFTCQRALT